MRAALLASELVVSDFELMGRFLVTLLSIVFLRVPKSSKLTLTVFKVLDAGRFLWQYLAAIIYVFE